ncbi:MAG: hypothetical protein ACF8TS_19480, partial [Maioricimonas sp. JB049]
MLRPHSHLALAGLLVCMMGLSGCSEGIGGGAASHLHVAIKLDADADDGGPSAPAVTTVEVAGYGQAIGRILIDGDAPRFPPPVTQATVKDPASCVLSKIPNERLVIGVGGGIANVFVYLEMDHPGTRRPYAPL